MSEYYFTFRSLTSAQQATFLLSKNGVFSNLIRAPKALSSMGCGYALRISSEQAHAAASQLRSSGIRIEKTMLYDHTGRYQEVWL